MLLMWRASPGTLPAERRTYQLTLKYERHIHPAVLMDVFLAGEYYEDVNKKFIADKLDE